MCRNATFIDDKGLKRHEKDLILHILRAVHRVMYAVRERAID